MKIAVEYYRPRNTDILVVDSENTAEFNIELSFKGESRLCRISFDPRRKTLKSYVKSDIPYPGKNGNSPRGWYGGVLSCGRAAPIYHFGRFLDEWRTIISLNGELFFFTISFSGGLSGKQKIKSCTRQEIEKFIRSLDQSPFSPR